jgi:hypothetical protein
MEAEDQQVLETENQRGKRNLRMEKEIKGKKQNKRSINENRNPEIHCKVKQIRNNNPGWSERESGKLLK